LEDLSLQLSFEEVDGRFNKGDGEARQCPRTEVIEGGEGSSEAAAHEFLRLPIGQELRCIEDHLPQQGGGDSPIESEEALTGVGLTDAVHEAAVARILVGLSLQSNLESVEGI
jgi:hypothetical protein